jgi:hypothetical protein
MNQSEDLFKGLGIRVRLKQPDDFLKVRETLTRIGVASERTKTLYQSCHILHKRGEYAICHFKEMFVFDGKASTCDDEDLDRRDTVANLLASWGLVELLDPLESDFPRTDMSLVKIIPFRERSEWTLERKYNLGKKE